MRKSILSLVALTLLLGACSSAFKVETKTGIILEYGDELKLESLTDDTTVVLKDVRDLDAKKIGIQSPTIIFTKDDKELEVKVDIEVKDTILPDITLTSDEITITEGIEFDPLSNIESIKDPVDGDIAISDAEDLTTNGYKVTGDYDSSTPGTYDLLVTAYDLNSNKTEKGFKLIVKEKEVAVVTPPATNNTTQSPNTNTKPNGSSTTPPSNTQTNTQTPPATPPATTPTPEPVPEEKVCPNGRKPYRADKPCDWIIGDMMEQANPKIVFATYDEAYAWGEAHMYEDQFSMYTSFVVGGIGSNDNSVNGYIISWNK